MLKLNEMNHIVKVEVDEYHVTRDAIVKKWREAEALFKEVDKDLREFDRLINEGGIAVGQPQASKPVVQPLAPQVPPAPLPSTPPVEIPTIGGDNVPL